MPAAFIWSCREGAESYHENVEEQRKWLSKKVHDGMMVMATVEGAWSLRAEVQRPGKETKSCVGRE